MQVTSELSAAAAACIFTVVIEVPSVTLTKLCIVGEMDTQLLSSRLPSCDITHLRTHNIGTYESITRALNSMSGVDEFSMIIVAADDTLINWYRMIPIFTAKMNEQPFPCIVMSTDTNVDGGKMLRLASGGRYIHRETISECIDELIENLELLSPARFSITAHDGARFIGRNPKYRRYAKKSVIIAVNVRTFDQPTHHVLSIEYTGQLTPSIITTALPPTTLIIHRHDNIKNPEFKPWTEYLRFKKSIYE